MGLSALELVNLLAGGPKKPALAPADATAVAQNKGIKPPSPEEAAARPLTKDFAQHRDSLYDKFGDGASQNQYSPEAIAGDRGGWFEPISGFENSPHGKQVDSAYTDVGVRAEDAANARREAGRVLAQILQQAQKQSGQRKVP